MISEVQNYNIPNLGRVPKKTLDMQDFIQLFITQLQYQDPMNPIENNEMATQVALFTQVDQLFKINETLENLMDMKNYFYLSFVSNLVGKKVKVETNIGRVENGEFLGGEFYLEEPAESVEIVIKDKNGNVVDRIELNNLQAGKYEIEWDATDQNDNPVSDGDYTFSIIVHNQNTTQILTPIMVGKVTGVKIGEDMKIMINNNFSISIDDMKEILGG